MRKLDKPVDDSGQVFLTCISRVKDPVLKARLILIESAVIAATNVFDAAAAIAMLHQLPPQNNVGGVVSKDEMSNIYTQRMAKKGAPGRSTYDKLLAAPVYGRCPLCGQRAVSTLDHHLPKDKYPALAVAPINLIPACAECNKLKTNTMPQSQEEQTLHPYFDDIEGDRWLQAEIIEDIPTALRFFVQPPREWDFVKASRTCYHFNVFKLASLYASYAAEELSNIRYSLKKLSSCAGAVGVRKHLQGQEETYEAVHFNSWQTAMYKALVRSQWFCEIGLHQ